MKACLRAWEFYLAGPIYIENKAPHFTQLRPTHNQTAQAYGSFCFLLSQFCYYHYHYHYHYYHYYYYHYHYYIMCEDL